MCGRFTRARIQKQQHYNQSLALQHTQESTLRDVFFRQIQSEFMLGPRLTLRHLATCSSDSTIRIWSTINFEYTAEKTLTGHQRWVWDAAFSADSAYLVTGECHLVI